MKSQLGKETLELDQMNNQIASLRSQYEMKKMSLALMNSRLNEKTKLILEAKKGYNAVLYYSLIYIDNVKYVKIDGGSK